MIKKLVKHGNSYAIIVSKPIMELLGVDASTELEVNVSDQMLTVRRVGLNPSDVSKDKKTQKLYEQTVSQYDALLKKLSQN